MDNPNITLLEAEFKDDNYVDIPNLEKQLNLTTKQLIYLPIKRLLDIIFSLIGLIVLSPLFIIVAIIIKLDSPGPIFFKQKRVGKDGKLFTMYKFRSMVVNAEAQLDELREFNEMDGPVFKIARDPRVTKSGRWIRRTAIDELPQLFNVLTGQMTIVGPRPCLPSEFVHYKPWQKQRVLVKQGLTCYWQVRRSNTIKSFDTWMRYDNEYIQKMGFMTDMLLILKTVKVVMRLMGV